MILLMENNYEDLQLPAARHRKRSSIAKLAAKHGTGTPRDNTRSSTPEGHTSSMSSVDRLNDKYSKEELFSTNDIRNGNAFLRHSLPRQDSGYFHKARKRNFVRQSSNQQLSNSLRHTSLNNEVLVESTQSLENEAKTMLASLEENPNGDTAIFKSTTKSLVNVKCTFYEQDVLAHADKSGSDTTDCKEEKRNSMSRRNIDHGNPIGSGKTVGNILQKKHVFDGEKDIREFENNDAKQRKFMNEKLVSNLESSAFDDDESDSDTQEKLCLGKSIPDIVPKENQYRIQKHVREKNKHANDANDEESSHDESKNEICSRHNSKNSSVRNGLNVNSSYLFDTNSDSEVRVNRDKRRRNSTSSLLSKTLNRRKSVDTLNSTRVIDKNDGSDEDHVLRKSSDNLLRNQFIASVHENQDNNFHVKVNKQAEQTVEQLHLNGGHFESTDVSSAFSYINECISNIQRSKLHSPYERERLTEAAHTILQSVHLVNVIKTADVRNKPFLLNTGTLMGKKELKKYLPDQQLKIFVATWNMAEMKEPPANLDDLLLPFELEYLQDMYIIGTQESTGARKEWEIRLQQAVGPSHVLFHSYSFAMLHIAVFLRRDLIWFCSVPEEGVVLTRPGSMVKTKGAVAISFTFFGTSFLVVTSHFTSGTGKASLRISDYQKIIKELHLPKSTNRFDTQEDVTARFDNVFWCGDLNFRINRSREYVEQEVQSIESASHPNFEDLVVDDELKLEMIKGSIFSGFQEGKINFRPTYKYDLGIDSYDTSEKARTPAYTDRILFRCKKKNAITCCHYDTTQTFKFSDHRPVYAVFKSSIRSGRDDVPLAAGMFERDVYLEAMKRRVSGQIVPITIPPSLELIDDKDSSPSDMPNNSTKNVEEAMSKTSSSVTAKSAICSIQ